MAAESLTLQYASPTRRTRSAALETLATAMAFFGSAATAGGVLLALGIEWINSTLLLTQTHQIAFNIHLLTGSLLAIGGLGVLSTVSACCITARKGRRLSLGIAVLQLIVFPIGTVIALFALLILNQRGTREMYRTV